MTGMTSLWSHFGSGVPSSTCRTDASISVSLVLAQLALGELQDAGEMGQVGEQGLGFSA